MRIICDMDEVLVDFINPLIAEYNRRHQSNLTLEDIKEWKLPPGMLDIFQHTKGFFVGLSPLPGAIDGIKQLTEWGHDVIIASAPSYNGEIAKEKLTWIEQWLPNHTHNVVITHRKEIFEADLIIDDHAHHIENFKRFGFLVDRPWNRYYNVYKKANTIRIREPIWENILEYVRFADHTLSIKR